MSLCAYHRRYIAAPNREALAERVKSAWKVDLKLKGNPDNRDTTARMDVDVGDFILVEPCPYGYLAIFESQERLTGDRWDRIHAYGVDYDNWLRMEEALAKLKAEVCK